MFGYNCNNNLISKWKKLTTSEISLPVLYKVRESVIFIYIHTLICVYHEGWYSDVIIQEMCIDVEGGSVIIDTNAVESMERLMLSDPTQSVESCGSISWQYLELLVSTLQ
jgi:hypothetical protein